MLYSHTQTFNTLNLNHPINLGGIVGKTKETTFDPINLPTVSHGDFPTFFPRHACWSYRPEAGTRTMDSHQLFCLFAS